MHLEGTYTFAAPVQTVWDALLNPENISGCMPGRESFQQIGPHEYQAAMKVKIGPVSGAATGRVRLSELQPPSQYRMDVEGGGGVGHIIGGGVLTLREQGRATVVSYVGDAQVTGRVARVGQRLLGSVARTMINQFFRCMDSTIAR